MAMSSTTRLVSVIGSRPEVIQAAPLSRALSPRVQEILVHTGQHYDVSMSEAQILDTGLPTPDFNLGVGSLANADSVEVTRQRLLDVIDETEPAGVLVRGDTNATLGGALAATDRDLPLFHVEAGLRSHRLDMPEEHNRIETDRMSDVLFAPTDNARRNLLAAGVRGDVHLTGDVLNDVLCATRERLPERDVDGDYVLATVHRNYNTDDPERLAAVLRCLGTAPCRVIFPLHPRTRARIAEWKLDLPANVLLREPVPYSRMLALERDALAIATDSGGVQREAYIWGVRCITIREETEWVETVETGWNTIVGTDAAAFLRAFNNPPPAARPPLFGDGHAADKIAQITAEYLVRPRLEEVQVG
jgi:UDP-N-acetylglucosamine 2-epimerase